MNIGPFEIKIFKTQEKKLSNGREIGETGTSIFGGQIENDEYVNELIGSTAIETYNKMRKSDGVVKATLLACELPIRAANWFIKSASDDPQDIEVKEFVEKCLFEKMTITWDDFLRQAMTMLPFGFSVFEKVFEVVKIDGKQMIGWRKLAPRLQSSIFSWETQAGKNGVTQLLTDGKQISIPIEKLLIFTNNKEGDNWEGVSVLRSAYRPWFFKEHIEKINAIAFERQGLGIPRAEMPKNYTSAEKTKVIEQLQNIRANEQSYLLQPEGWSIEFMDMMAKTLKDPDTTIKRYNREILISVLAQFLDLGTGPTGSRALSSDQSTTFHNNLTAIAKQIKDVINKYAIKQLVDLNYNVSDYPTLEFNKIGVVDYEGISQAIKNMVESGVIMPDNQLEKYTRDLMNLPEKEEQKEEEEKPEEKSKEEKEEGLEASEIIMGSEFSLWRKLTFAEEKVNFKDLHKKMDEAESNLRKTLNKVLINSGNDIIRQMQVVLNTSNSKDKAERLQKMAVKYQGEYRKAIFQEIRKLFEYGKMMAAHEMKKTPPTNPADSLQGISRQADGLTEIMATDLLKVSKLALLTGLQQKKSNTEIMGNITKAVKREVKKTAFQVPAISVGGAINQGRRVSFDYYNKDIYALQRSELLDNVTCSYCLSVDSRIFRKNDSFTRNDNFHSSCRGLWVEIMKEESVKPPITGIPKALRERYETINVFNPPKNPIVKRNSPAGEYLRSIGKI